MDNESLYGKILSFMKEGVLLIRMGGIIERANEAALKIFEKTRPQLVGKNFSMVFLADDGAEANDELIQCVLDTIYARGRTEKNYTTYHVGGREKQLRIVSSTLPVDDELMVILVISDVTELMDMRDTVKAMKKISRLNSQLEKRNQVLQTTFGRYLSDEIVEEIMRRPDGWQLGGHKTNLTVMMTDLRGFTALCERMEPTDVIDMVNNYFSEMYEEINRYGGTIIEFLGDGMLVIFGALGSSGNHAEQAVAAAVAMERRMDRVNQWNETHRFPHLTMGIGINTGDMILGNIGSEHRIKFGVLGAAVNLAGRMESYASQGQVIISPGTRAAVESPLEVYDRIEIQTKGISGTMEILDICSIGEPYNESFDRSRSLKLEPLPRPAEIVYQVLDGKHLEIRKHRAVLTEISGDGAVMQGENLPERFVNIVADLGAGLYAKIVGREENRARLVFTSRPEEFQTWMEGLLHE